VAGVTLVTLSALIDQSLLRLTPARRYEQHELVRQYASEKLQVNPEEYTQLHARHSEYYLGFLQEREELIMHERAALDEIRSELENVRSAWKWAMVINHTNALQQGLKGLAGFYRLTGLLREGERIFSEAVLWAQSSGRDGQPELLCKLLAFLAGFQNDRAKYPQAIETAQQAAELAHTLEDPATEALANLELSQALRLQEAYFTARRHINLALSLARANRLTRLEAEGLHMLGNVAMFQRNFSEALEYQEQSLQLFVQSGNRHGESAVLKSLGNYYYLSGNFRRAQEYYQAALDIFRERGDRRGESHALNNLGAVTEAQGNYLTAKEFYRQSLTIVTEIGDRGGECAAIANLAHTSYLLGNFQPSIAENERVIAISRGIELRGTEAVALSNLGLIAYQRGDYQTALNYQDQAQQAHQLQETSPALSYIRFRQGRIFFALGMIPEAGEAYQEALELRRGQGHFTLILETQAGLAELSLYHPDFSQFDMQIEQVWASLASPESDILNETDDPFWLYLTCYRAFSARQDPRALQVLSGAYEQLSRLAANIPTEHDRALFLNCCPSHREISQIWLEKVQQGKSPERPIDSIP
jgi:tetratricopeptide (TPR) repeat protein